MSSCTLDAALPSELNKPGGTQAGHIDQLTLLAMGTEYFALKSDLGAITGFLQMRWAGRAWTERTEEDWSARIDAIYDQMEALSRAAASRSSRSLDDLRIKAMILLDIIEPEFEAESDMAWARLTLSLCRDLITQRAD